ncbi:hypothetical protein ABZV28_18155 [Streptomyces sp. NPDC004981]|uniref:hypothetical protein n=1 Tax=Streptomyces sp. NPDC004981 TaxID=3156655 RepID=UPI0033BA8E40
MMRSAADWDTRNSGASCRKVRFVRQVEREIGAPDAAHLRAMHAGAGARARAKHRVNS